MRKVKRFWREIILAVVLGGSFASVLFQQNIEALYWMCTAFWFYAFYRQCDNCDYYQRLYRNLSNALSEICNQHDMERTKLNDIIKGDKEVIQRLQDTIAQMKRTKKESKSKRMKK